MKRIVKIFLHYLLGILGIILISCVPAIFSKVTSWSSSTYWEALKSIFTAIFHPTKWEISYQGSAEVFSCVVGRFYHRTIFLLHENYRSELGNFSAHCLFASNCDISRAKMVAPRLKRIPIDTSSVSRFFLYFPYSNGRRLHISTNRRVHLELLQLKRRANLCSTNRLLVHHTNCALLQNDDAPYGK